MKIRVLSRDNLAEALDLSSVIEGVEAVYQAKAQGKAVAWPLVEYKFENGGIMDIRSGGVFGDVGIHGAKLLNNFPKNAEENLPVFTGILMAFDSRTGLPIGVMDASYITSLRTGAAAAIGAATLAKADSETLLLVGAGRQAIYLLGATLLKMPRLRHVIVADPIDYENAVHFTETIEHRLKEELGIETDAVFEATNDLKAATGKSDVILTITRSTAPLIMREWVKPGTHLSCIGADMVGKEEIDPEIFRTARAFADDAAQCCTVGEMEIPAKMGIVSKDSICGEIGQVLNGQIPGRTSEEDITIFDATGLAALDLVTAKVAVKLAEEKNMGTIAEI